VSLWNPRYGRWVIKDKHKTEMNRRAINIYYDTGTGARKMRPMDGRTTLQDIKQQLVLIAMHCTGPVGPEPAVIIWVDPDDKICHVIYEDDPRTFA